MVKNVLRMCCLAAALCAQGAHADDPPDTYSPDYVSVLPGIVFPSKSLRTTGTGATISGIYGHEFNPHILGELNIQSSVFDTNPFAGVDYQNGVTFDVVYQLRDRAAGTWTPFVLLGAGPNFDDFYPNGRDGASGLVEGGVGIVSQPLFKTGLRLRFDARYVRDSHEGWHQEPRAILGIDIPLGRIEHRVEIAYPPAPAAAPPAQAAAREVPMEHAAAQEVPPSGPDADGDGVDDAHDKCPDTPRGLRVDAEGCAVEDQAITLEGVHFEFNKTRITVDAGLLLDRLSLAFIGQPTLHAEIAGYTDSVGRPSRNLALSQQRAEAVRKYLIARGARPDQLIARGYGKAHLLVSPARNEADAERNRRVELKVLTR